LFDTAQVVKSGSGSKEYEEKNRKWIKKDQVVEVEGWGLEKGV
jgi:hypothetical protein